LKYCYNVAKIMLQVRRQTMQAERLIYEHAPSTIPIPTEFHNLPIEVLFLRLNTIGTAKKLTITSSVDKQMKRILLSEPENLSALSLDTTGFKFDREEANAR
jgi:hypothetical protein